MNQERVQQLPADYVVGYCFQRDLGAVTLIEKIKPTWQRGKYNGVGGKIEPGETAPEAMSREFFEEAGVLIPATEWLHIRTEQFTAAQEHARSQPVSARVYHFAVRATAEQWDAIFTKTEERIVTVDYPLRWPATDRVIYNLPYLIPMAAILLQQPLANRPLP